TNVGGMGDLLTDGETGLLTADDDDEQMVEAIRRLLNDPALAAKLSANGRRLAERSSWKQVRLQWEAIFDETLSAASNNQCAGSPTVNAGLQSPSNPPSRSGY